MRFFSYVADARKTIMANKMRSGLSTLGIVIGMAAVIVMMAIGQGVDNMIAQNMGEMSQNKLSVFSNGGYRHESDDGSSTYVRKVVFNVPLIEYIEHYFPELSGMITYQIYGPWSEVKIKKNTDYLNAIGVPANWFTLNEKEITQGNFFTSEQYEKNAFVAIVNKPFVNKFFKNTSPIGKKFTLAKKEYTIVWVLKEGQFDFSSQVYVPSTTLMNRIFHKDEISNFDIYLPDDADNTLWKHRLTYLLMRKFNVKDASAAGFEFTSFAKFVEKIKQTTGMMTTFLLFIGSMSLLIWGIGVMNIMIVSVTERTREIWIRKAIWALNKDIIMQFLIESLVITFLGGLIAMMLSFFAVKLINGGLASMGEWPEGQSLQAAIDQKVVVLSFLLTAATGIIFGILPARKAAKLKPIDALRFE